MAGLRVIAGSAKGRRLRMVPGGDTRPISDRAKQALFNIIGADIEGATFLDLFAGTGSVAIEALSRGAARAVLVEASPRAIETIRHNLEHTRLADRADVIRADAFRLLNGAPAGAFDYIYIAPPQYHGLWSKALLALDASPSWLNPDAWVVAQIHPRESEPLSLTHLVQFDERKYGSTLLCFYERPGE